MKDFTLLSDDGLVDALIIEIGGLLQKLIEYGEEGTIDLLGLPLTASCVSSLDQRLGQGEVTVLLAASGQSEIRETGFPGVWRTKHSDEAGRIIAMLIEVTCVPAILRADPGDIREGYRRLLTCAQAEPREQRKTA
jgi:hydrogenase-1 operon protein HyaF